MTYAPQPHDALTCDDEDAMARQYQQQPPKPPLQVQQQVPHYFDPAHVEVQLFVVEEDKQLMPKRPRAPTVWPAHAPTPRIGELVYLSASSAWLVANIIYSFKHPRHLVVEVWLTHYSSQRDDRPTGFALTQ